MDPSVRSYVQQHQHQQHQHQQHQHQHQHQHQQENGFVDPSGPCS
jgi:hypothetical protein